jgi:S-adenosyl methyltransferase
MWRPYDTAPASSARSWTSAPACPPRPTSQRLRPVALLHFVSDEEDPHHIVAAFRERPAPGSLLVLSHATYEEVSGIESLFRGAELVEPGTRAGGVPTGSPASGSWAA